MGSLHLWAGLLALSRSMTDHSNQSLSKLEIVRVHAYPLLATVSSLSLIGIVLLLLPQPIRHHRFNRCVDAQIQMRDAINHGSL